ncbi:YitT family protein [Paenibacillus sp. NPDC056579]|uniref:YitT family protein n=1 Tax=Paenibacillus sp. NPDC056579 TaxID=3345871 RepID=UPI0036BEAFA8
MQQLKRYVTIAAGTFAVALSFNWFLSPNQIASGGLSGASILLGSLFRVDPSVMLWIGSLLVLLLSVYPLGIRSLAASAAGSLLLPFFVYITKHWEPLTGNPLLASIYGGIMTGIGLGLVIRAQGNTGGFTLIAQIIYRWRGVKHSKSLMVMDSIVVIAAGIMYAPEKPLYALICVFLTRKTIDVTLKLHRESKVAYIISSAMYEQSIARTVLHDLDRGLTKLSGTGGYTDDKRVIMMTVLGAGDVHKLKLLVQSIDPQAFLIFCNAEDVVGVGFTDRQMAL